MMFGNVIRVFAAALLATATFSASAEASNETASAPPAGMVQQGTFASEQLQNDITPSMHGILRAHGCQELLNVFPYVRVAPTGLMGARNWTETWVYECSNGRDEIDVTFQETPDGGADYSVKSNSRHNFTQPVPTP